MESNICNFIPYKNDYNSLHTVNFVFEKKQNKYKGISTQSVYKVHYVHSGKGILHLTNKKIELKQGDVFFTFPGIPFCIESIEDFKYMYITFLGARGNMIMDKLGISKTRFYFEQLNDLLNIWEKGIKINSEISDLITESILLYTFYYIGEKLIIPEENYNTSDNLSLNIKKYIDDNYSDHNLSLESISEYLKYSPKYISSVFKKNYNITLSDYITTLRIQHACTLISHGFTSISDISNQCGYSDPHYFSKIFKKTLKVTPREYIKNPNT